MARAFTLIEAVIVIAVIGVLAAMAVPGIVEVSKRAAGEQAVRETAAAVSAARDAARGKGVCLDYVQSPAPPSAGPYTIEIFRVSCPDEPLAAPVSVASRALPLNITQAQVSFDVPVFTITDRVHFHRDGSLYNPAATITIQAVIDGITKRFHIYPAAGSIELEEVKP